MESGLRSFSFAAPIEGKWISFNLVQHPVAECRWGLLCNWNDNDWYKIILPCHYNVNYEYLLSSSRIFRLWLKVFVLNRLLYSGFSRVCITEMIRSSSRAHTVHLFLNTSCTLLYIEGGFSSSVMKSALILILFLCIILNTPPFELDSQILLILSCIVSPLLISSKSPSLLLSFAAGNCAGPKDKWWSGTWMVLT